MTQAEETQEENDGYIGPADDDDDDDATGEPLPPLDRRVREPNDLPEPMAADVAWPDVDDLEDVPIGAQYAAALSELMSQADAATERIESLYRNGIREIRELVRGS